MALRKCHSERIVGKKRPLSIEVVLKNFQKQKKKCRFKLRLKGLKNLQKKKLKTIKRDVFNEEKIPKKSLKKKVQSDKK